MKRVVNLWRRKVAVIFYSAAFSINVHAGGIPVIDVVSVSEQLRSYVQQIADYQVYIDQLNVQDNQYVQMVQQYRQTITEYNHLLNQIKALDLDAVQLAILDRVVETTYGNQPIGLVASIDPGSATAQEDTDTILRNQGYVPRSQADLVSDYEALNATSTNAIVSQRARLEQETLAYQNQMDMVQQNQNTIAGDITDKIIAARDKRRNLGPESDLATAQHIAEQQAIMMDQLNLATQVLNQQLMVYESPTQAASRRKIAAMESELSRLQRVAARRAAEVEPTPIAGYGTLIP